MISHIAVRSASFVAILAGALFLGGGSFAPVPAVAQSAGPAVADKALDRALQDAVSGGAVPGALLLVSRHGRVEFLGANGYTDAQSKTPLRTDTVFWLASMSKPVTAVAVLMLVEQGKIGLDEPVSRFIPELKTLNVKSSGGAGPTQAAREITIRDLLTHTSGIISGVADPAMAPIGPDDTLATWVPKLAATPLEHQPGAAWVYSNAAGFDVLSRVVEVASGQPLEQFFKRRIFDPLGMRDTGFGRRPDLAARTAPVAGPLAKDPRVVGTVYHSGAAGLWSTAEDYRRFAEMLADGGQFGGKRLLKPGTVAMMGSDQARGLFPGINGRPNSKAGTGFGFGMVVVTDADAGGLSVPIGSFGWDGAGGGRFWSVPAWRGALVMFAPNGGVQAKLEAAVAQHPRP
jgi:CubicO group peptidase (beta-lactamase class C family)